MGFCSIRYILTLDRDNCLSIICYTVLTLYVAKNRLLNMYGYTFYPLRDPSHKLPTTRSTKGLQHKSVGQQQIQLGDRAWVRRRGHKMFSLPHMVPEFLLLGLMLIEVYGWNIPDSTVLSIPVKLSHMGILKSDFYTTFNGTCVILFCQHFIPAKRQTCIT